MDQVYVHLLLSLELSTFQDHDSVLSSLAIAGYFVADPVSERINVQMEFLQLN